MVWQLNLKGLRLGVGVHSPRSDGVAMQHACHSCSILTRCPPGVPQNNGAANKWWDDAHLPTQKPSTRGRFILHPAPPSQAWHADAMNNLPSPPPHPPAFPPSHLPTSPPPPPPPRHFAPGRQCQTRQPALRAAATSPACDESSFLRIGIHEGTRVLDRGFEPVCLNPCFERISCFEPVFSNAQGALNT